MFLQRQVPSTAFSVVPPVQPSSEALFSILPQQSVCRTDVSQTKSNTTRGEPLTPHAGKSEGSISAAVKPAETAARTTEAFILGDVEDGIVNDLAGLSTSLPSTVRTAVPETDAQKSAQKEFGYVEGWVVEEPTMVEDAYAVVVAWSLRMGEVREDKTGTDRKL
jgi:hypothetical protein